jgi:N-acyl-D-amino-acid deacylase
MPAAGARTLLKNGLLVDGTGSKGVVGNLLICKKKIERISQGPIDVACRTVDCTGKVIAPGFIDIHSHMDWVLPVEDAAWKSPFTAQGCTTFVAGNCGLGVAGFRRNSAYKKLMNLGFFPDYEISWNSMEEYFSHLRRVGLSQNLVNLAGHGTTRISIRGHDPSPLRDVEMDELLGLLEESMDQGAWGVSLGLQYVPGLFATRDELRRVARLVKKKEKILTVHARAYSALVPGKKVDLLSEPQNVQALKEMIGLARQTGVRLQYSHLMFAGAMSHGTYRQCLDALDSAIAEGVDIMIDTYPYHCGNTTLDVVFPKWFQENLPENYHNEEALRRLEVELAVASAVLGFGYADIQITYAGNAELNQYNGMFLSEIAERRGTTPFRTAIEIAQESTGRGVFVLLHKYSNMEIIDALIKHPACLFMTDAVPSKWLANPAAYGAFPLLLQYARERKLISLEEAVRKMTGASAKRVGLKDRGLLKEGLAADITVFDWEGVRDNNTLTDTDNAPTGIEAVFINGRQVKAGGKVDESANAGVVISG